MGKEAVQHTPDAVGLCAAQWDGWMLGGQGKMCPKTGMGTCKCRPTLQQVMSALVHHPEVYTHSSQHFHWQSIIESTMVVCLGCGVLMALRLGSI